MPVLTTIRQSPAYLYVKTYCLCAAITLFQVAPASSRFVQLEDKLQYKKQQVIDARLEPSTLSKRWKDTSSQHQKGDDVGFTLSEKHNETSEKCRPRTIIKRWVRRAVDLAQVKKQLRTDDKDLVTYPELNWGSAVRHSSLLHPEEQRFIKLRKHKISSRGANPLHSFLGLPEDEQVDPQDVPLIGLGGSGGGYRAMYGFAAFMSASKRLGLWDCLIWTAGVSGSCWTLAAYYTVAKHDFARLLRHYPLMAGDLAHPLSIRGLNTVVRSKRGVYFLIGPLVRKVRSGIIGLGIMDLFGTLTTAYQFLSREPGASLSRATFQFSKVWTRSGIDKGLEPMPLFTAVRRAPKNASGVKPHIDSSLSKGQPPTRALEQHQTNFPSLQHQTSPELRSSSNHSQDRLEKPEHSFAKGFFQWFEISPLEIGSSQAQGYIPTWSWGRSFVSGHSVGRPPEQSLSLLLGQCTSAPAGPLTGYLSALLASLPKGTIMSRLLLLLNDFVRMKKWERLWGNPIRAGHDPNPFYGHNDLGKKRHPKEIPAKMPRWEAEGRIRLMDSGMSNNLPNHVLARPERCADILLAFDASSDVQKGSAIQRIQNFADDCNITLADQTALFDFPVSQFSDGAGLEVESKFLHHYARVFRGQRETGQEVYLVYCPLLPNGNNPAFDPSVSASQLEESRSEANVKLLSQRQPPSPTHTTSYGLQIKSRLCSMLLKPISVTIQFI
jgi:phospholipase A2